MAVHSRAKKARIAAGIFRGARTEIFDNLLLGHRGGEAQRLFQPEWFRDRRKQSFDGLRANGIEHLPALRCTLGKVAHQAEVPFSETKASYAAASIRPETSAGLASLTLMSHPAPCGSEFKVSGVSDRVVFASVTSPDT